MQILTLVAPVFAARCSVVVADDGTCVVVDPGAGAGEQVRRAVAERDLHPRAVLVTHGHADHTWDAPALADAFGVPVLLHAGDAYRLDDPFGSLGVLDPRHDPTGPLAQALAAAGVDLGSWHAPAHVETFGTADGDRSPDTVLDLGGVRLTARHAPGHTEGSTLYVLGDDAPEPVVLSGDVLFAGSVGRTDLPGGDPAAMATTLRDVVGALPRAARVLPGHGPATDVATELATNPYLRAVR
ncbi:MULTISPECIES: MBL fold metallo-hydrolase [Cellulomonas]|uniref:Glyoxylase-like metal-dependent hydrolase (Beta-lactamase superfamily II) n=1 Tax=Cellulomonas iranensis TaxID=76862 RepID=A0ABU0GP12_9CELL|nr:MULTISPECIES: MBL fold metallo-hydrolase [Cellulomonas]MDQ0427091.1 glyoxylase-like metal-dependent hydrolase (beta-lactamase superfamily II) [Cellulomonas iranensis]TFH69566.1 MBL fold metallo-hydrolase [Cellulomonas sp. HD19AZ1]